ncbi:unnamed protein product [Diamesa tonsa]
MDDSLGFFYQKSEINTDDELDKFLEKDGILVLDVYADWCGNCVGMVGSLKKAKLEIGGDNLQLAICKSDSIQKLHRFRNRSEPTWLICAHSKIVNMLFGTNVPRLMSIIVYELDLEEKYKLGEAERVFYEFDELLPDEQELEVIRRQIEEDIDRIEMEQAIQQRKEYIHFVTEEVMQHIIDMGITIFFPHTMKDAYRKTADIADKMELTCKERKCVKLKPEMLEVLHYDIENPLSDDILNYLYSREMLLFLWKLGETDTRAPEEVLNIFYRTVAEPIITYDESGENILSTIPPILDGADVFTGESGTTTPSLDRMSFKSDRKIQMPSPSESKAVDSSNNDEEKIKIRIPSTWTPLNKRANAAFIYTFFRNQTEHFLPPDPVPEPQHLCIVFDAYKRNNIFEACKENEGDVLSFGYFSSEDIKMCTLLAKTTDKYENLKPTVSDKLIMKVAKKQSDITQRLARMGPCYISPNTVIGKEDCHPLFPPDYNVIEEEEIENESLENESKKKKNKKRRKKRVQAEGDEQSQSVAGDQMSGQDSEDTLDDMSADEADELDVKDDKDEVSEIDKAPAAPAPTPNP